MMRAAIAACFAVILAALLAAQSPHQQPTFRAGVSLVWVDVYATRNGEAVGDLRKEDFDVREDGVSQRIETFERIVLHRPTAEIDRDEPANIDESNEAAGNPRNRLFVLFYDTLHTFGYATPEDLAGNASLQPFPYDPKVLGRALSAFFHRLIGPDDLLGLLTPEMAVTALTFTRRPSSLDDFLLTGGHWERHALQRTVDDGERDYIACGPQLGPALIGLRRYNLMMGALRGLITHLESLREGRKVVFVVSEGPGRSRATTRGWPGFGAPRMQWPPRPGPIRGLGRGEGYMSRCQAELAAMARGSAGLDLRQLLAEAKRANVAFYPIDPRGLTVERLNQEWLMTLASGTDGRAIVNLNDPTVALDRVAREVSSYYLLGYYSTSPKEDGKFRTIRVRARRSGVEVRARPGYYASSGTESR